jgi:hypothetical protein
MLASVTAGRSCQVTKQFRAGAHSWSASGKILPFGMFRTGGRLVETGSRDPSSGLGRFSAGTGVGSAVREWMVSPVFHARRAQHRTQERSLPASAARSPTSEASSQVMDWSTLTATPWAATSRSSGGTHATRYAA